MFLTSAEWFLSVDIIQTAFRLSDVTQLRASKAVGGPCGEGEQNCLAHAGTIIIISSASCLGFHRSLGIMGISGKACISFEEEEGICQEAWAGDPLE